MQAPADKSRGKSAVIANGRESRKVASIRYKTKCGLARSAFIIPCLARVASCQIKV